MLVTRVLGHRLADPLGPQVRVYFWMAPAFQPKRGFNSYLGLAAWSSFIRKATLHHASIIHILCYWFWSSSDRSNPLLKKYKHQFLLSPIYKSHQLITSLPMSREWWRGEKSNMNIDFEATELYPHLDMRNLQLGCVPSNAIPNHLDARYLGNYQPHHRYCAWSMGNFIS